MIDARDLLKRYLERAKAQLDAVNADIKVTRNPDDRKHMLDLCLIREGKVIAVGELQELLEDMEAEEDE